MPVSREMKTGWIATPARVPKNVSTSRDRDTITAAMISPLPRIQSRAVLLAVLFLASATFADNTAPPTAEATPPSRIRVACVGDSITWGFGIDGRQTNAYPAQLGRMLGSGWRVRNYGVSARTLLNKGDLPYQKEGAFRDALKFEPDFVIILLGANDSKPTNWKFKDEFATDYKQLIEKFKAVPSHPTIYICRPTPVPGEGNFGINEPGIQEEIKLIDGIARDENIGIIDLHKPLEGRPELLPDRVHPNAAGATVLAKTVYETLTARQPAGAPVNGASAK